ILTDVAVEQRLRIRKALDNSRGAGWCHYVEHGRVLLAIATEWFEALIARAQSGLFDGSALHADLWSLEHAYWCDLLERYREAAEAPWLALRVFGRIDAGQRVYAQKYFGQLAQTFGPRLVEPALHFLAKQRHHHRRIVLAWMVERSFEVPESILFRA